MQIVNIIPQGKGYGRRRYQQEYIRFLTYAISSNDETLDHLEILFETGSLKDEKLFADLHSRIDLLGKKLNLFIQSIEKDLKQGASAAPVQSLHSSLQAEASSQQPESRSHAFL